MEARSHHTRIEEGAEHGAGARRGWTKPVMTKLKKPSDAQTGIIIGPEVILLLQS